MANVRRASLRSPLAGRLILLILSVAFVGLVPVHAYSPSSSYPPSSGFNQPGNLLITDQFNNRVSKSILTASRSCGVLGLVTPNPATPALARSSEAMMLSDCQMG